MDKKIKVLLDTDIGDDIDDAFALALLLNQEEIELVGITTVYKNTNLRSKITKYELKQYKKDNVKVISGIDKPLKKDIIRWPFEEVDSNNKIIIRHYKDELMNKEIIDGYNAPVFILESIKKYPDLVILAIGPLTNLAEAYLKDKDTFLKLKELRMMGGTNDSTYPEWNMRVDPEAADIVLSSGVPIKSVGVDITRKCTLCQCDVEKIKGLDGPMEIVKEMMMQWMMDNPNRMPTMHDPLAAFELTNHFCDYKDVSFDVDLPTGKFIHNPNGKCHISLACNVDERGFIDALINTLE